MPKNTQPGTANPNATSRRPDRIGPDISLEGPKQFAALARVSSREQEREGFSLEVQEEALARYAEQEGGTIIRLVRIAETASKTDERKAFREAIEASTSIQAVAAGLLGDDPPTQDEVQTRIEEVAGIAPATARRRASTLVRWRAQALPPVI